MDTVHEIDGFGTRLMTSKMALERCAHTLQACGYTLVEFASDQSGCRYKLKRQDGTEVVLEAKGA